jgi:hypothetical protein
VWLPILLVWCRSRLAVVGLIGLRPRGGVVHDLSVDRCIVIGGWKLGTIRQGRWWVGDALRPTPFGAAPPIEASRYEGDHRGRSLTVVSLAAVND